MDGGDVVRLVLLAVALVFSIFFSGSEAAFLSVRRGRLASCAGFAFCAKKGCLKGSATDLISVMPPNRLLPLDFMDWAFGQKPVGVKSTT